MRTSPRTLLPILAVATLSTMLAACGGNSDTSSSSSSSAASATPSQSKEQAWYAKNCPAQFQTSGFSDSDGEHLIATQGAITVPEYWDINKDKFTALMTAYEYDASSDQATPNGAIKAGDTFCWDQNAYRSSVSPDKIKTTSGRYGPAAYLYRLTSPKHPNGIWLEFPGRVNNREPNDHSGDNESKFPTGGFDYTSDGERYKNTSYQWENPAEEDVKIDADITPINEAIKKPAGKSTYCTSVFPQADIPSNCAK